LFCDDDDDDDDDDDVTVAAVNDVTLTLPMFSGLLALISTLKTREFR